MVDVPVPPQFQEQIVEVVKMIPHGSSSEQIGEITVDSPVPQGMEEIMEVVHTIPQERVQSTIKHIIDVSMPHQFQELIVEVRSVISCSHHRTVDWIVSLPVPEVVADLAEMDQITSQEHVGVGKLILHERIIEEPSAPVLEEIGVAAQSEDVQHCNLERPSLFMRQVRQRTVLDQSVEVLVPLEPDDEARQCWLRERFCHEDVCVRPFLAVCAMDARAFCPQHH